MLCAQEVKCFPEQLEDHIAHPSGYYGIWHPAKRPGYSGVATFVKQKPTYVLEGLGIEKYDTEGRVIMTEFDTCIIFNVYFPNGQMGEHRLQYKLDFYRDFFAHCDNLRKQGKNIVICGDYNTAHHEIDLARPKENETTSGFLPVERAWLDEIVSRGYVDTFRHFHPEPNQYSWWSFRSRARERNVGWRIDYIFVNREFLPQVKSAFIHASVKGSDHCPVGIETL